MVDVVRDNFSSLFPRIEECIKECDFLAIDTEFTGLHATREDTVSLFDTIEERYCKLKKFASTFIICQLGLSTFTRDSEYPHKYVSSSFNFYVCPRTMGSLDRRFSFQASNIDFLCEHKFDFNKMFYEGIHHINTLEEEKEVGECDGSEEEKEVGESDGKLREVEMEERLGLTRVFRLLEKAKKPLLGHNMLCDLALILHNFFQPLPDSYIEFKARVHLLFPVIIDTKHLCFGVQKKLSQTKLLDFTSLIDLCGALGSQRGTYYALYSPEVTHSQDCQRYNSQRVFHEAGFDAHCVGFVFLRVAHLLAMKGVRSVDAQTVPLKRYFKLVEQFINRVNLIRGPIHYIDLVGNDPPPVRSPWLVVSTPDRSPLTLSMLQQEMDCVMDTRRLTDHSALVVLSSRHKAEVLLKEMEAEKLLIRRYRWTDSSHAVKKIGFGSLFVVITAAAGATAAFVYFRTRFSS